VAQDAVMDHRHVIDELRGPTRSLRRAIPDAWAAFADLNRAAVQDGVIPTHLKQAVALALAVVKHCDGCIAYHARDAARAGATPEEVAEILALTVLMDGGPSSVYAPRAWAAFEAATAELAAASEAS
jgi:AhpD family alkylhydroperoxidase